MPSRNSKRKKPVLDIDPVSEFWGNIDCSLYEGSFGYILDKLLADMRARLKDSCPTAVAIDTKQSISRIAQLAEKEGLQDFAEALRFAQP